MLFAHKYSVDTRLKIAIASILASFVLVFLGLDRWAAAQLMTLGLAGAAIAGAFYTLGATTPFAMVVILELMQSSASPYIVALVACAAASLVDCALFSIVKDSLEKNAAKLVANARRWFSRIPNAAPIAGFFVFGMPLPDELGLALMEMTTIRLGKLAAVIFLAKFLTLLILFSAFAR